MVQLFFELHAINVVHAKKHKPQPYLLQPLILFFFYFFNAIQTTAGEKDFSLWHMGKSHIIQTQLGRN